MLPSPEFERLAPVLSERMQRTAAVLHSGGLEDFLDLTMKDLLRRAFQNADAHEGAVWLVDTDSRHLVISHAWGKNATRVMGYQQPLTSGLVSMVFATEQPFCENQIYANRLQDKELDEQLGMLTCSMIAVPLVYARGLRGVVSCIKAKDSAEAPDPPDFPPNALSEIQFAAHLLGKLIEFELVGVITGWDNGL